MSGPDNFRYTKMNSLWRHIKRHHAKWYEAPLLGVEQIACPRAYDHGDHTLDDTENNTLEDTQEEEGPNNNSSNMQMPMDNEENPAVNTAEVEKDMEKTAAKFVLGLKEKHRLTQVSVVFFYFIMLICSKTFCFLLSSMHLNEVIFSYNK